MSQTTGAGGSATPGWYTDPHDPGQLRWWSGEGWTEHVSGGSAPAQPVAAQPVAPQPVAAQPVAVQPIAAQPAAFPPAQPTAEPLPSRRALRDPATEASEAAEAALQAQQQAFQAQQPQAAQPQAAQPQAPQPQAAQFPAPPQQAQQAPPQQAQQVPAQPSAPVPTLPVQPKSFLEQAGYAPMDAAPATPNAWNQPGEAQPSAAQPSAAQPPAAQPNAWETQQPAQNQWNQPQAQNPQAPAAAQNQWNQPATQLPPVQQGWDAPGSPVGAPAPQDGIDSLFGGGPAAAPAAAPGYGAPDQSSWGLSPTGPGGQDGQDAPSGSRRRGAESSAPESSGSSTFWGWLIAISPILAAGAIGYVIVSTGYVLTGWPIEAAIAAPYLLVLLFALADRAALHNLGHAEPRSPGWALLSAPVYLIVRAGETRREDGSGTALTLVWFFSFLVAIAGFVGWGFLTHHALYTGLPVSF